MRASAITLIWLLLLVNSTPGPATGAAAAAPNELRSLQEEVQDLKQLLSMVLGAEPFNQTLGFLPETSNTQRLVARQPELWPQHFAFLSAVAADASVACSHVMTDKSRLAGGPLYLVLADQAGRLYFFTPQGQLLHEFDAGVSSPITALSSDLVRHNETHLAVGHADGTLTVLSVGHEHPRLRDGSGIRAVTPLMVSTPADRARQRNDSVDVSMQAHPNRHVLFSKSSPRRLLLAVDASGCVVLLAANSGHMLMTQQITAGPPLAVNVNSNFQVVVQTETATAILLMKRGRSLVTRRCFGLAHPTPPAGSEQEQPGSGGSRADAADRLVAAVFDPLRAFRAFGVTAGGELVVLTVPSGMAAHQCKVLQRVQLGLPPGPVQLVMGRGRLVLLHSDGVAAFNLSTHKVQLPGSYLVSNTWQQLWRLYGLGQQHRQLLTPLAGTPGDSSSSSSVDSGSDASASAGMEVSGSDKSDSSIGRWEGVLHSPAWDSPLMVAAAAQGLLLLPFGSRGMAVFAAGHGGRGTAGAGWGTGAAPVGSAGAGGGGGGASSGGGGADVNWARALQPFVVIMMIVVGVWQFVRASNRSQLSTRRAARYGNGLAGLDEFGGLMSRSQGLASSQLLQGELGVGGLGSRRPPWGLGDDLDEGSFSRLDRDFGPYAGPRGRREQQQVQQQHGPLGALTARRRARAAMFSGRQGTAERQQPVAAAAAERGAQRMGGAGGLLRRRGGTGSVGSREPAWAQGVPEEEEFEDASDLLAQLKEQRQRQQQLEEQWQQQQQQQQQCKEQQEEQEERQPIRGDGAGWVQGEEVTTGAELEAQVAAPVAANVDEAAAAAAAAAARGILEEPEQPPSS